MKARNAGSLFDAGAFQVLPMAMALVFGALAACAGTYTWDGGGTDNNWLTAANWSPDGAPANDGTATLAFSGTNRTAAANNFAADTVFSGISLLNNSAAGKTAAFTLSGNRLTLGGGLSTTTASSAITDTISLNMLLSGTRTFAVNSSHHLAVSGVIGETGGSFGLTKTGSGTLTLTGANTYSGTNIISGGILSFNSIKNVGGGASALGAPTTVESGTISLGARIQYTGGTAATDRNIDLSTGAGATFDNLGSGTLTLSGGITGTTQTITFRGNANVTVNGLIATGSGAVNRTDGGTLTLGNDANSFSGGSQISHGAFSIASLADSGVACALGTGNRITLGQLGWNTSGKLQFNGSSGASCNRAIYLETTVNDVVNGGIIENTVAGQALRLSGTVAPGATSVTNQPRLQLTGAGNGELSGVISGSIKIDKSSGAGTWVLSGANTYTGATVVSAGTLLINGSTHAGSAVSVAAGGTLGGTGTVNGAVSAAAGGTLAPGSNGIGTLTLANAGASALTLNGNKLACELSSVAGTCDAVAVAGALVLNGANTVALSFPDGSAPAGTNTLMTYAARSGSGSLALDHVYPNATLVVSDTNATLVVTDSGTVASLLWQGDGAANAWDKTTANWSWGTYLDNTAVVFDDTGSDTPAVNITPDPVSPYSVTVNTSAKAYTIGGAGIGGGAGGLLKSGTAALTLTGANTYSGATAVNAGSLTLDGSLSNSSVNVASGAVFTENAGGFIAGSGAGFSSSGTATLVGANTYGGATTVSAGSLTLDGSLSNSSVTVASGGVFTQNVAGAISGSGVSFANSGTAVLSGANTYGGATLAKAGTLTLTGSLANSRVIVSYGATFSEGANAVIAGANVVFTNYGTATLAGSNTFGGVTSVGVSGISNIVLYVNNDKGLGSPAGGTVVVGGTTANFDNKVVLGTGVTVTDETLTLASSTGRAGLRYNSGSGTATWDGNIVFTGGWNYLGSDTAGGTLVVGASADDTVTSANQGFSVRGFGTVVINSTLSLGSGGIMRDDPGTLQLNAVNTDIGNSSVVQGTLKLGVANALPPSRTLTIGKSGSVGAAVFDLNGMDQTISGLVEAHYAGSGTQRIISSGPATLTVSNSIDNTFGTTGSSIEGKIALVKAGTATLTLTGTNSYSGATVVSGGTLAVGNSGMLGTGSTNVVVAAGTLALQNPASAVSDLATVRIADGGAKIDLAASVNETVSALFFGGKQVRAATYGGTDSGAQVISATRFSGTGILTVLTGSGGSVLMVR